MAAMAADNHEEVESMVEQTSNEAQSTSNQPNRAKSDVWNHFVKNSSSKSVKYSLCERNFAYHGGTSNLRDHLLRFHSKEFSKSKKAEQPSLDLFVARAKCPKTRADAISSLIADLVARDLRPLAIVEGEGFKSLLKYIEPGYKVPSATHIAQVLRRKHEIGQEALKRKLEDVNDLHVAITTDIWTSCANDAYISLTAHYISSAWEMISCVLSTSPFPEQHTAVNIVEKLTSQVGVFGLVMNQHVRALVHDQGSNMEVAGRMLEAGFNCESLSCAAHRLQLCVNEGLALSPIARAIAASRKLVGHFRHSARATTELRKRQESMGIEQRKLQQDCPTRWNSSYYMIKTLLCNRWPMAAVLSDEAVTQRRYRYLDLSSDNWELLDELIKVLHPIEIATTFLSEEYNSSLSVVFPVITGIVSQLAASEDDMTSIRQFKVTVAASLRRRWSLDSIEVSRISILATALDPRFRALRFLSNEQLSAVKEKIKSLAVVDHPSEDQLPKRKKSALDMLLGEDDIDRETDDIHEQLSLYFSEKPIPRESSPLNWWKQNELRFPVIAMVAKSILCVPATSTPSERLFSAAGLTVNKLRSSLKPENVDGFLFLNKNFNIL